MNGQQSAWDSEPRAGQTDVCAYPVYLKSQCRDAELLCVGFACVIMSKAIHILHTLCMFTEKQ